MVIFWAKWGNTLVFHEIIKLLYSFLAYLRDKDHFKDDCYGMSSDSILDKKDTFYGPNTTNSQTASNSYPASNISQVNLLEPQKIEQSGFLGEAGEVSYDEGLSWHPVEPISDNCVEM